MHAHARLAPTRARSHTRMARALHARRESARTSRNTNMDAHARRHACHARPLAHMGALSCSVCIPMRALTRARRCSTRVFLAAHTLHDLARAGNPCRPRGPRRRRGRRRRRCRRCRCRLRIGFRGGGRLGRAPGRRRGRAQVDRRRHRRCRRPGHPQVCALRPAPRRPAGPPLAPAAAERAASGLILPGEVP